MKQRESKKLNIKIEKCKQDIVYFAENFYSYFDFYAEKFKRKFKRIKLIAFQKECLKMLSEGSLVSHARRQLYGKTTLCSIFALWSALFFENNQIVVYTSNRHTADNIYKNIRDAINHLPKAFNCNNGLLKNNTIFFNNGSKIIFFTSSIECGKILKPTILIADEYEFFPEKCRKTIFNFINKQSLKKFLLISSKKQSIFSSYSYFFCCVKYSEQLLHFLETE